MVSLSPSEKLNCVYLCEMKILTFHYELLQSLWENILKAHYTVRIHTFKQTQKMWMEMKMKTSPPALIHASPTHAHIHIRTMGVSESETIVCL